MRVLIAFDWNGTLVDDVDRAANATSAVLVRRGLAAVGRDEFRERFRLPLDGFFRATGIEESDLSTAEREWNVELRATATELAIGAADTLAAIASRGWSTGVVSAAAAESVLADVGRLGVGGALDFVWTDRADKTAALRSLRSGVDRLVYVGDAEYDMECALEADALAVGFGGGYRPASALRDAGAVAVVDDHRRLLAVLDDLVGGRPLGD